MHPTTASETRARAVASVPRQRGGVRRRDPGAKPGAARRHRHERRRPARGEIDAAALKLLATHGAQIVATARRYAATPEDAEDAYQRGLEILLRKAPSTSEDDLVPWLKTVVKHEAFALRRHRERHAPITDDGDLGERGTPATHTHDQAELYEDLRQGAEALRQLKPQEIRALQLRAEGYSYKEICEITGWTYTKVNRALTEGRQALAIKLAGIKGGIECAKLAPQLLALADGDARTEQAAQLQLHMRSCLSCRARLKSARAA
jgi:RNA polymerase sigma factor (sigma-70 family)